MDVGDGDGDAGQMMMRTSESRQQHQFLRRRHQLGPTQFGGGRRRAGGGGGGGGAFAGPRRGFHPLGRANAMRPSSSYHHDLPDANGYYDEEMEYDDGPFGVSRGDHNSGQLEYVDGGTGGGGGGGGGGVGFGGFGGREEVFSPLRRGGYGHDDHGGGYDDHHGGYDDHHGGYGDDHDHGYSPVKKPGPFGYGKPNYKCEYAKETLYVSKTTYKFKKKCYKILKVKCKSKYGKGKKIGYKKICNEFSVTKCRTIFATKFKTKCWLVYKKKCEDFYKTKIDWVYKEKCKMVYEKECHGYGYHKSCHEVPKEICKQVWRMFNVT